jgi:hypothetical protein
VERETGLGGDVGDELERAGANCGSENSHSRLLAGDGEGPEDTGARQPCNSVTRPSVGEDASDPVLARLAALREHWRHAHDTKVMRRGLLDLLRSLEEE